MPCFVVLITVRLVAFLDWWSSRDPASPAIVSSM